MMRDRRAAVAGLLVLWVSAAAWISTASASAAAFLAPSSGSGMRAWGQLPPPARCGRRRALFMRGEDKEQAIEEKQIREKQSQVLLAQRVQHIKRLRKARREDIVETEWYNPKQPNREWRNAFDPQQQAPAAADDTGTPKKGAAVAGMVVDEVMEMIEFKAERGSGGAVVNVYARETTQAVSVTTVAATAPISGSAGGGSSAAVRAPLRRNDYAPLAAWRELQYIDSEGREVAASYNRMRNGSRYLVVLAGMAPEGLVIDGLKRMRIVPPHVASVVGVCPTPPHEAVRLVKKHGLNPGAFLSDVDGRWLAAHGVGGPRALRPFMLVLDGARGVVLSVVRDPAPGSVNDLLAEAVGDWRGGGSGGL